MVKVFAVSAVIASALFFSHLVSMREGWSGLDFFNYWTVAHFQTDIPSDFYKMPVRKAIWAPIKDSAVKTLPRDLLAPTDFFKWLDITSTPFLYSAVGVFLNGSYPTALNVYRFVELSLLIFCVLYLCRCCGYSWAAAVITSAVFLSVFGPLHLEIETANVTGFQLGFLTACIALASAKAWRFSHFFLGVAMGLMMMFKPTLLFVPGGYFVFCILQKHLKWAGQLVLGAAAGVLAAFAQSVWFFGTSDPWLWWFKIIPVEIVARTDFAMTNGNFSISAIVQHFIGGHWSWLLNSLAAGVAMVYIFRESRSSQDESQSLIPLLAVTSLLAPPLSWFQYKVLFIPLLVVVLKYVWIEVQLRRPNSSVWAALMVFVFLTHAFDPRISNTVPQYLSAAGGVVLVAMSFYFQMKFKKRGLAT